ncbi:MAG: hypothetical protein HY275_13510 [Gemmatimonadetes bacterium]|nr:hypothetical protein [Gemmatimonadota bacterium]
MSTPASLLVRHAPRRAAALLVLAGALAAPVAGAQTIRAKSVGTMPPSPDPRIGLKPGRWDAGEAIWNLNLISATRPSEKFTDGINSDIAFSGTRVIQGSFNGWQIWDIANPAKPVLAESWYCPGSQSDVSTYKNLLFVSGEGSEGRLDCAGGGVKETVSKERLKGLRIFDITDIKNPKPITAVQTCRGSHTHSVLVDPKDPENVYVYISGSAPVRPEGELPGCVKDTPDKNPNSALFRIEVIKVPLAHPEQAAIVSSPRIFNDLVAPPTHGLAEEDKIQSAKVAAEAKAKGRFTVEIQGATQVLPDQFAMHMLDSLVKLRNGTGAPTAADSAKLREDLPGFVKKLFGEDGPNRGPKPGPTQCHDITLYPGIGYAGGACEGYGLLLDIRNPAAPVRIGAVSDSNFSYWHSATFNNDGTKVLFSDEWGGGMGPKCRASDPKEWGADAIFTLKDGKMEFQSYYKLPAAQTSVENCVAHNGSMIPIPGRDVMVQAWYQGGISVFEFTDPKHPTEIAFFDRGPQDPNQLQLSGSWSVYWYNGLIVSSEIGRGLDILELTPSAFITQNAIDAAQTVKYDYLNAQGQPKMTWAPSFPLVKAYADQVERANGLPTARLTAVRAAIASAEKLSGAARSKALHTLGGQLDKDATTATDAARVKTLAGAVHALASAQ